jgi:hypothetical protein
VLGSLSGISQTQPKSRPGLTLRQIFAGKQDLSTQSDKVELTAAPEGIRSPTVALIAASFSLVQLVASIFTIIMFFNQ